MWVEFYVILLFSTFVIVVDGETTRNSTLITGCYPPHPDASCQRCGPNNGCIKCSTLIVYPSRKCVDSCPPGYRARWSTMTSYLGRVCVQQNSGRFLGIPGQIATVIVGSFCGLALSVVLIVFAVAFLRHKKKRLREKLETNSSDSDENNKVEKGDFLKQLETLRPYGDTFLDMLNDTRKQLRELRLEGDNAAASVYKPVVRDLAKILILLNRPMEETAIPDDWEHLFSWAEKALKRYKRMSEASIGQVAQLIDFLQAPIVTNATSEEVENPRQTTLSTFKPEQQSLGSTLSLNVSKAKNSTSTNAINPQWKFSYPLVTNNPLYSPDFSSLQWKNSKEYLSSPYLLEDDFFQLGFRPQDVITTEL